jgi:spore coat protein U-like protein
MAIISSYFYHVPLHNSAIYLPRKRPWVMYSQIRLAKLALSIGYLLTLVILTFVFMLLVICVGANSTRAGTDTGTLLVNVTVVSSCSVVGSQLDFGTYTAGQPADLDAQGTIEYTNCSGNLTFELDGGQGGNVNARQMRSGTNNLGYQLYRNAARTNVFGTGTNARILSLSAFQSGFINVYGKIPGNQLAAHGSYTDTVNITLQF